MNGEQILNAGDTLKKHKEKPSSCTTTPARWAPRRCASSPPRASRAAFKLRGGLAAWRADNLPLSRA